MAELQLLRMPSSRSYQIPEAMRQDTIIAEVDVSGREPTGATHHTRGGKKVGPADMLRLVRLAGDESIYLIHYNANGNELTDTCHSSVEEALDQAEFEYALRKEDWVFLKGPEG
jgi:hypothetical protein